MAPMAEKIENRGPELLGVNIFFVTAAVIATALRCLVRAGLVKAFGRDDWLMLLALVFFICYSSFSIAGVHYGTGRHFKDLEEENIHKAMECWWYCYLFYALSMITSKMSIAYFLLRIATKKVHVWIIYTAMLFTVLAGIVFFFVTLFQCLPIARFWNKNIDGSCIDVGVVIGLAFLYSAFSVISDLTFAILPCFLVWGLQLKTKAKLALIPLLVMGCVASSAVVVRFAFLMNLRDPDFLWATLDIAIWSSVEQGLAITAGSLATIRPLLKLVGYKLGMTTDPSRMRMTDDKGLSRRPSAFMKTSHHHHNHRHHHHPKSGGGGGQQQMDAQEEGDDAYGLYLIPCSCCGNFKCQNKTKTQCGGETTCQSGQGGGKSQSSKRSSRKHLRSSLGFRVPMSSSSSSRIKEAEEEEREEERLPQALSNVKSVSESEEELNAGRARGDLRVQHDGHGVVPKSFMS